MTAGKGDKLIAFEEIKDALAEQVGDDTNVVPKVKGIPEVYALVPIVLVVLSQCGKDSQLDTRCISVLLHGTDDLDGDLCPTFAVPCLNDLAESALTKQAYDGVLQQSQLVSEHE